MWALSLACVLAAAVVCDAAQLLEFVPLDALQAALNAGKPIVFATPGRPESEASIPVCTLPDGIPEYRFFDIPWTIDCKQHFFK